MKFFVETYGCTMNFGEGREMSEQMAAMGYTEADTADDADIIILNTCTVVGTTEKHMINRIADFKKQGKEVVVTGCLAAAQPRRIEIRLPGAPIIPPRGYDDFAEIIKDRFGIVGPPTEVRHQTDAILPIAQGCLGNCTYCITKIARGNLTSYDPDRLVEKFRTFVDSGVREILVTAQDTACYGRDNGVLLPELLRRMLSVPGDYRVRIGMMNPNALERIVDDLLEVMKDPRVYRFLHVPIQSGSDAVLERMNRRTTTDRFEALVAHMRSVMPDISLATDVICGFPGETDEDHQMTIDMIRRLGLDTINITRFSPRPGTAAADMEQVHGRISHDRSVELTQVKNDTELMVNSRLVGNRYRALATERGKDGTILRTGNYRPVVVRDDVPLGEYRDVEVTEARSTYLFGRLA